jgi:ATP-binding cassette subfamily B protein
MPEDKPKQPGIFSLLKPYSGLVFLLILFALFSNSVNLWLPKIISHGIDDYIHSMMQRVHFDTSPVIIKFSLAVLFIFMCSFLQSVIQTYTSEKVARDLRTRLSDKISRQSHAFVQEVNPSKLLTNLTADVDSIKLFVSQALVSAFCCLPLTGSWPFVL